MIKFAIIENKKRVGEVKAENTIEALKQWIKFAGPGNYSVIWIAE